MPRMYVHAYASSTSMIIDQMLTAPESIFIFFISLGIVVSFICLLAVIHCFLQCKSYRNESESEDSNIFDIIDLDKLIGRYEFIEKERLKRQSDSRNIYKQETVSLNHYKNKIHDNDSYSNTLDMNKLSTSTEESTLPIYLTIDGGKENIGSENLDEELGDDNNKLSYDLLEYQRTWKGLDDELKMIPFPMYTNVECQTTETLDKISAEGFLKKLLENNKTIKPLETLV
uniref:Envelope glycoprotein UL132 n=1 Tax=Strongyloides stercoralis TaxID=6248 RepID=A0A0K0EFB4_STRER